MWKAVLACVLAVAGTAAAQPDLLGGMCPMITQGAQVTAADTATGAALDFTIAGDPTLLRARVHQIGTSYNQVPNRTTVIGQGSAARNVPAVPSQASVEDTPTGARLILTASDPAQIGELRRQVRDKLDACRARQR